MTQPAESLNYCVVVNARRQHSIWPEDRQGRLPAGWTSTGFRGPKETCLQHIATESATAASSAPTPPPPRVSLKPSPPNAADRRTTALPFPQPAAPIRLFVFPHAGSGASYYHFLSRILRHEPIEVHLIQYPGREMRLREPPLESMERMCGTLGDELQPLLREKPFAFLGHSMGSLIAFELSRQLSALGVAAPWHLFLSGRQGPQIPGRVLQVEQLSDADFLDAVGNRYNALPAELLAHREILELILPSLRADFTLMQRYTYRAGAPSDVHVTLLNGREDPWISPESLAAWQTHFVPPIRQHLFAGGHFYLPEAAEQIKSIVVGALCPAR